MPAELFVGGPLAGWREPPDLRGEIHYPVPTVPSRVFSEPDPTVEPAPTPVGTYTRYLWWVAGWRIVLPVWLCHDDIQGRLMILPHGTVLPGHVIGQSAPSSPLCAACRRADHCPDLRCAGPLFEEVAQLAARTSYGVHA